MAEPTTNRQTLRREICRDLGMPFYRRFPSGLAFQDTATSGLAAKSDTTQIRDSRLTQGRDTWKNSWAYDVGSGEFRLIVDHVEEKRQLIPEYDFDSPPSTSSSFEILSINTPQEIHDAINDAIQDGFPSFFDVTTDETLILEEDKLEYELVTNNSDGRGILSNPYRIKKVAIERIGSGSTFTPTSATATTLVNSDLDLSGVGTAWSISVYAGTGSGQYAVVSSVNSATGTITVPSMTVTCDTTSKVRYWERKEELYAWEELAAVGFDAKDYPNKMRMLQRMPSKVGLRFRIQYVAEPQTLSTDTGAGTAVPKQFIKMKAMSKLLRQRARMFAGDREKYAGLAQLEDQGAEKFRAEHAFDLPDQQIWTETDPAQSSSDWSEIDNPLGW